MKTRTVAFSLVELLIVIAIISILAASLIPSIARLKEGTRSVTCLNNLRQLGIAFQSYRTDHNGSYPASVQLGGIPWDATLMDYGCTIDLLHCPSDREERDPSMKPRSYAMNDRLYGGNGYNPVGGIPMGAISRPVETILLSEWHFGGNIAGRSGFAVLNNLLNGPAKSNFHTHNQSYGNVLWFDGHATSIEATNATDEMFTWSQGG